MRKSYLLLLFFIVEIYTALPKTCGTETEPNKQCVQNDCTTGGQTTLYSGKCYTPKNNCNNYNPNYDACYECKSGYELDDTNTHCVVKHCATPGSGSDVAECATCNPGFTGDGTASCSCSKIGVGYDGSGNTVEVCDYVTNCVKYDNTGKCTKCKVNYFLEANTADTLVASQQKCTPCASGKGSNGDGDEDSCLTKIDNCIEYENDGTCKTCANDKLKNAGGTACETCPTNTHKVEAGGYCVLKACELYDPSNADCGAVENCIKYDTTGCIQCNDHMKVVSGTSCEPCYSTKIGVGDQCIEPIENCETYDISTKECTSCKGDNELKYGVCVAKCKDCTQDPKGNGDDTKASGNADGSDSNMMRLNIIYMAIMLMIIV